MGLMASDVAAVAKDHVKAVVVGAQDVHIVDHAMQDALVGVVDHVIFYAAIAQAAVP